MLSTNRGRNCGSPAGSATVEQIGIFLLLAVGFAVSIAMYTNLADERTGRSLGDRLANRITCGPRAPGVCRQHPAVSAYGWDLARALRGLAPEATALPGPSGGPSAPVDFRYCQRSSCAVPGAEGLTTANRRLTLFTEVRRIPGEVSWEFTYWFYRPSLGWDQVRRRVGQAEIEAASGTRVLLKDIPRLVPLEILPGRNHYNLPPGEEPPWRWKVNPVFKDWSA